MELSSRPDEGYLDWWAEADGEVALAKVMVAGTTFVGSAKRNPIDVGIPEVGVNLALGRALRQAGQALIDNAIYLNDKKQSAIRHAEQQRQTASRRRLARLRRTLIAEQQKAWTNWGAAAQAEPTAEQVVGPETEKEAARLWNESDEIPVIIFDLDSGDIARYDASELLKRLEGLGFISPEKAQEIRNA